MKILVAGLTKNIQLLRLREEGKKRGHEVNGCYASDLTLYCDGRTFEPKINGRDLSKYDLIYMIVGKRRWEWYTAALYLNRKYDTKIVNQKSVEANYNFFLTPAIDYLKQTENNLPYPASAVLFSTKNIDYVIGKFNFPLIVKTSTGRQGRGVYMVEDIHQIKKAAREILTGDAPSFIIREFIPNDGDIRIFTVGYKAIGAMKRIPKKGEFRSNISQGGRGEKFDLKKYPEIRELAENAAKITRTEIAGVDIIVSKETGKPYILEVNPAPQFAGLEGYTGVNAAEEIIKYFEKLYNTGK